MAKGFDWTPATDEAVNDRVKRTWQFLNREHLKETHVNGFSKRATGLSNAADALKVALQELEKQGMGVAP